MTGEYTESASSITIHELLITLSNGIGLSAFSLPDQPCQVLVTVTCHLLPHCLEPSPADKDGVVDDWDTLGLGKSVNYSALGKSLSKRLTEAAANVTGGQGERVGSLEDLLRVAVLHIAEEYPSSLTKLDVKIERRRALLFAESVSVFTSVDLIYPPTQGVRDPVALNHTRLETRTRIVKIHGIQADTVVGLNPHERIEKQRLELDVELDLYELFDGQEGQAFDYKSLGITAHEYLLTTSFKTLESLAHNLVHHLLLRIPTSPARPYNPDSIRSESESAPRTIPSSFSKKKDVRLEVQIRKPAAIAFAKCPSIEMSRTLRDYEEDSHDPSNNVDAVPSQDVEELTGREIPEPEAQPLIPAMRGIPTPAASSSASISECGHDHPGPCGATGSTSKTTTESSRPNVLAYIAIGTNLGDRIGNIKAATQQLARVQELLAEKREIEVSSREAGEEDEYDERGYVRVKRTSRLYESRPMYVLDQGEFINGVIEIETNLSPLSLLLHLKRIENHLGRVKTLVNGPRLIDLDLTFYGEQSVSIGEKGDQEGRWGVKGAGWLEVPHWAVGEREFVLRPLVDLNPALIHPTYGKTVLDLLNLLQDPTQPPALNPIIPFPLHSEPLQCHTYRPLVMGILNVTPDSFSDGSAARVGSNRLKGEDDDDDEENEDGLTEEAREQAWLAHVLTLAKALVASGADILDIGGMSTRPGVKDTDVTVEEELARVVPVIQAIRLEGLTVPISVDTFRPQVAARAVEAGASCVNDVRGGREDGMLKTMAELECPIVLMHSRGDSVGMLKAESKDYSGLGGVVEGVKRELMDLVERAEEAGVRRWNIILDPGIGFAKTHQDNLLLLKSLPLLFGLDSPLAPFAHLVGASRKGFIGTVLDRPDPMQREFGNAAINAKCTMSGVVDVLRVHEVKPAKDVVKMMSAIEIA